MSEGQYRGWTIRREHGKWFSWCAASPHELTNGQAKRLLDHQNSNISPPNERFACEPLQVASLTEAGLMRTIDEMEALIALAKPQVLLTADSADDDWMTA